MDAFADVTSLFEAKGYALVCKTLIRFIAIMLSQKRLRWWLLTVIGDVMAISRPMDYIKSYSINLLIVMMFP